MKNLLTLAITTLLLQVGCTQAKDHTDKQAPKANKGYQLGDQVADFALKNIDGKTYKLSDAAGENGAIIIFTSNTCPFAVAYEDRIAALHTSMSTKGYPVIAINSNDPTVSEDDSFDKMIAKQEELGFTYLYLQDDQELYSKFGATKTPELYLLDATHTIVYKGAIDDSARAPESVERRYVEDAVMALANGDTPDPQSTKAIGCSIKTKKGINGKSRGKRRGPPTPEALLTDLDADKDNHISKNEARGPLADDFDSLDTDKNGLLSKEELSNIKGPSRGGKGRPGK